MLHHLLVLSPLLIMLFSVLSVFATSEEPHSAAAPSAISRESGMLRISIDPRIELLAVIQYTSGSKMAHRGGSYAGAIGEWFAEYQNHPVMQRLRDMEECGYVYDLPVSCFLRFEDCALQKISFNWDSTMETMNLQRLECVSQTGPLEEFYDLVRDFALKSDFAGFYASQREYFQRRVDEAANALNQYPDMIAHMVAWYGYSHTSYNLVISPLADGGYGPAMVDAEGGIHAFCVADINCSDFDETKLRQVSSWLFHEFSHSYVNPLVDKHWDMFESGEYIYELLQDKMYHAYSSWWVVVAEHLVRVNDHRLGELYFNLEPGRALQSEVDSGFIFIRAAYDAIRQYEEEHQSKGIDYAGHFTTIARFFMDRTDISEEDIRLLQRFTGPINNVYLGDVLVIYPDPERVVGVTVNIMPTVEWMVLNKGFQAVSDQTALDMDLSNKSLVLFGAWGTNLILDRYRQEVPIEIYPDRIVADKTYTGTDLRIALCLPNPLNQKLGMCIYTAQTTQAMQRSNAIDHGHQDWLISNPKLEVLGSGNFRNKDGRWEL